MRSLFEVIYMALDLYIWIVILSALLSWLIAFNVVNTGSRFVQSVNELLYRLTEPALRPIRKIVPPLGGIDISPVILIFIIYFLELLIRNNILS